MVSSAIIHVIGTTSLIAVLTIIMIYVSTTTHLTLVENEEKNLQKIADSITLQILYVLQVDTNISLRLQYPVEAISNHKYNIYIGSGASLTGIISGQLDPDTIYVVLKDPSNNVYAYSLVVKNSTSRPIILRNNPIVFGSTTATIIVKTLTPTSIILEARVTEVIAQ